MPRSSPPVSPRQAADAGAGDPAASGAPEKRYTMAQAAELKGVSYHTVSRAVRRNKLPAQRLGRMALITAEDLKAWRPMRERAPLKYRRRDPNPDATPALLDLASGERVELARRLSSLYEILHGAAAELPLPEFLSLLCDRLAVALDFRRVVIWGIGPTPERATRLAAYGPLFSRLPAEMPIAEMPLLSRALAATEAYVIEDVTALDVVVRPEVRSLTSLFVAPLRVGGRLLGVVFGDCEGETFKLADQQLGLAQAMANQAALALDQARLRAAEASRADQLAAIIENVSEAVFAGDADGRLTVINAAGRALLGLGDRPLAADEDVAKVVGVVQRREFDGRPVETADVPLMRAFRGERVRDRQHLVIRPDGTERAVSVNAVPIRDGDAIVGAVAVARDITAERTAAERDAARLARLEAVASVSLAVNAGTDLPTVLLTAVQRLVVLLDGTSGAIFFREADGRMTGQVEHGFSTPGIEGLETDLVSLPTTAVAFARREPLYYTYDEAAPSERVFFDRFGFRAAIIAPLIVGEELIGVAYVNYPTLERRPSADDLAFAGALAAPCAVALDKTRLMDRIEEAHRRLLAVVDQLPQGIVIVEAPNGRVVLANRAAERLWGTALPGTARVTSIGLGLADADGVLFSPGDGPLERTLTTGEERLGETLTITRADGTPVTTLANHAPILDATGRIVGAVGVYQDVAELTALDRAKDEFLSIAAHELRNPLTSLHGNLQLLARRAHKEPARAEEAERLSTILAQSERVARLVDRLLDFSRAELGRLDLSVGPTDASAIVRRVAAGAQGLSAAHEIVVEAPAECPVVWDEVRIEQVLTNLVTNAAKYAPGGEIRLTLREAGDGVELTVRDQGPGIPNAAKARLFERYYRAPGAARGGDDGSPGPEGLGLGLYISRKIALAHGGDLTVADAPGGGALFSLALPRRVAAATGVGGDTPRVSNAGPLNPVR